MENAEIIHKIDDLGRILVPKAVRDVMNLSAGDSLKILPNPTEGTITLKLAEK